MSGHRIAHTFLQDQGAGPPMDRDLDREMIDSLRVTFGGPISQYIYGMALV